MPPIHIGGHFFMKDYHLERDIIRWLITGRKGFI